MLAMIPTATATAELKVTTEIHCFFFFFLLLPVLSSPYLQETPLAGLAGCNALFRLRLPETGHFPSKLDKGIPSSAQLDYLGVPAPPLC